MSTAQALIIAFGLFFLSVLVFSITVFILLYNGVKFDCTELEDSSITCEAQIIESFKR